MVLNSDNDSRRALRTQISQWLPLFPSSSLVWEFSAWEIVLKLLLSLINQFFSKWKLVDSYVFQGLTLLPKRIMIYSDEGNLKHKTNCRPDLAVFSEVQSSKSFS